jgi:hypothetical protein
MASVMKVIGRRARDMVEVCRRGLMAIDIMEFGFVINKKVEESLSMQRVKMENLRRVM